MQMDAPIPDDSTVEMLLCFPRKPKYPMRAEVVHTRWRQSSPLSAKGLYGVRFIDPALPVRNTLSHYVGERLRHLSTVD